MNSKAQQIVDSEENKSFWDINQQPFKELLTFVDFADDKLNIAFAEINFAQDRDLIVKKLIEHPNCQDIQFEVLDFSDPDLRFLRDELVKALQAIKINPDKKLVLLVTGLEKSIGILDEYPPVLVDVNYVRDDLRKSIPHPIIFFLPEYALTRLAKYAPDFWAWSRKVFYFKSVKSNLETTRNRALFIDNTDSLKLTVRKERIELLQRLLSEYKSSYQLEDKHNYPKIINIYNELGIAYYDLCKYRKAIDYHQYALKIAQRTKDRSSESETLSNLGNAYGSLGEHQCAINLHQQSLEISKKNSDFIGEAISLNNLGTIHNFLGEHQKAISLFQESLIIQQQINNLYWKRNSLIGLGNAYSAVGKYQQAIDCFLESLKLVRQLENLGEEAILLNDLGHAFDTLGEYKQAIELHRQSFKIAKEIGDLHEQSRSLMGLGNSYDALGEYKQAIEFHQQSHKIAKEIGDHNGAAYSLNNLGNAYYSLDKYQLAFDLHQQSLEIQQQIGDQRGEAIALFNLGNDFNQLDQKVEAKSAYEKARKLYQTIELYENVEECDRAIEELENPD